MDVIHTTFVTKGDAPPKSVGEIEWETWAQEGRPSKIFIATVSDLHGSAYIGITVPMDTLMTDALKSDMIHRFKEHFCI